MPDLSTGHEYVRKIVVKYLNNLLSIGVSGFRFDASKHMWPEDLLNITQRLNTIQNSDEEKYNIYIFLMNEENNIKLNYKDL